MDEIRLADQIPQQEPEPVKELWVPMRSKENGNGRKIFGQIKWNPTTIPFANKLEIDVAGCNILLQRSGISRDIEIVPVTFKEGDDTPDITSMPGYDVATASIVSKRINKPRLAGVTFDRESNKVLLFVNFSGIADYAGNTLSKGKDDPLFNKRFGQLTNEAVRSQMPLILAESLLTKLSDDVTITETIMGSVMMLPVVIAGMDIMRAISERRPINETALRTFIWYVGINLFNGLAEGVAVIMGKGGQMMTGQENAWSKYIDSLIRRVKDEGGLANTFWPLSCRAPFELLAQTVNNFTWRKPLLRGIKSQT